MRIAGITIPDNKRLELSLTAIYGISRPLALEILKDAGIDSGKKPGTLTTDEEALIRKTIEEKGILVEGELRREVGAHIKRFKDIGCYRGIRHRLGLPVRGQTTKNNARTRKGRKKTVANKKKATK